ncbi:helix-turn-helix transcriptional regulator, partial [Xylanibacter caecicola]
RLIVNKINESDGDDHNVPLTGETRHVSTDVAPICPNSNISSATSHGVNKSETDVDTDVNLNSAFVDAVTGILLEHISDADFTIDSLCSEMAMSRTLFYVKLKSYTGKSPQEFIRVVRLERAAMLLRSGRQVGDVAVMVGFHNAKYFSTVFNKYFGISPSKYK